MREKEEAMQEDHARWRLMAERREEVSAAEMAEMVEQRRATAAVGADEDEPVEENVAGRPDLTMRAELHAASVLQENAHGEVMQLQAICYGNWCV